MGRCPDKYKQISETENPGQATKQSQTEAQRQNRVERTIRTAYFAAFRSNVLISNSSFAHASSC